LPTAFGRSFERRFNRARPIPNCVQLWSRRFKSGHFLLIGDFLFAGIPPRIQLGTIGVN